MSEWTYRLNLSDIYHSDAHSLREKARIIANRIEGAKFFDDNWTFAIADVVDAFRDVTNEDTADAPDFDDVMRDLYDYADTYRVWVQTR